MALLHNTLMTVKIEKTINLLKKKRKRKITPFSFILN